MTQARGKQIVNQTLGLSLQAKRGLRNLVDEVYTDVAADIATVGTSAAGLTTGAPAGITGGTDTIYLNSVVSQGSLITTTIYIDLDGLSSSTTDLDIIGQSTPAAHIGQITAAQNGTITHATCECLEAPVGGVTDIDIYAATEATGAFDTGIGTLVEVAQLTRGDVWAINEKKPFTALPATGKYLYLTGGAAGTAAEYSAGKFLITLYGYSA